jgi:hypothetical protein
MKKSIKLLAALLIIGTSFTACTKDEVAPTPIPNQTLQPVALTQFDLVGEWDFPNITYPTPFADWGTIQLLRSQQGQELYVFYPWNNSSRNYLRIKDVYQVNDTTVMGTWFISVNNIPNTVILTQPHKGLRRLEFTRLDEPSIIGIERR